VELFHTAGTRLLRLTRYLLRLVIRIRFGSCSPADTFLSPSDPAVWNAACYSTEVQFTGSVLLYGLALAEETRGCIGHASSSNGTVMVTALAG
jgi:hypothetical protein